MRRHSRGWTPLPPPSTLSSLSDASPGRPEGIPPRSRTPDTPALRALDGHRPRMGMLVWWQEDIWKVVRVWPTADRIFVRLVRQNRTVGFDTEIPWGDLRRGVQRNGEWFIPVR